MRMKENLLLKVLAFLLAVAAFAGAVLMGLYQIANFNVIWGDGTPADGYTISYLERLDCNDVYSLLNLYAQKAQGNQLNPYQTQWKAAWESEFSADSTNLRWQARDSAGTVRYGNTKEDVPVPAEGLYLSEYTWWKENTFSVDQFYDHWQTMAEGAVNVTDVDNVVTVADGENWQELFMNTAVCYAQGRQSVTAKGLDAVYLDADGYTDLLVITDDEGVHVYGPTVRSYLDVNEYGYRYSWGWIQEAEPSKLTETLDITVWLAAGYPVADEYRQAYVTLLSVQSNRELLLAAAIACAVAGLLLAVYLCAGAGHKRGVEGIHLNGFHRIPGDLLFVVLAGGTAVAVCVLVVAMDSAIPMTAQLLAAGAMAVCAAALVLAFVVTFAARCKAHTLWKNTVIWRFCRLIVRLCRRCGRLIGGAAAAVPLMWQALAVGLAYLLFSALALRRVSGLWLLVTAALIACLCLWAYQWKRIRQGTKEIIGGHPDARIDTRNMLPDLRSHANELNNLGQAISAAVDEQMKSERFKAELITNVSHDLKTPLTSIINYVDLLKKEDIPNPTAQEYIEVLDRKSQRLKKLTEDLVEASKASTGALTVNKERLDVVQLIRQATGEHEEKLAAAGLTLVLQLPETPVYIDADGRHVWRVLDNLLGNCAKYALEGTRVYLDAAAWNGNAVITVKNVSRQPLNIPAEQLVERFVRGDESRTTEGSGLGLSIARSLTELQGGQFTLDIDGDLFKARVAFPLAQE